MALIRRKWSLTADPGDNNSYNTLLPGYLNQGLYKACITHPTIFPNVSYIILYVYFGIDDDSFWTSNYS